jgi:hypothetical protein
MEEGTDRVKFLGAAAFLAILELGVLLFGFLEIIITVAESIVFSGIITFWGVLGLSYFSSGRIDTGEMRRSIAATSTVIYFTLLGVIAFTDLGASEERLKWIVGDFTVLYGVIIGFYFSTKAYEHNINSRDSYSDHLKKLKKDGHIKAGKTE